MKPAFQALVTAGGGGGGASSSGGSRLDFFPINKGRKS